MNIDRFAYPNLKIPIAVIVGLFWAIVLGLWAGGGEFERLKMFTAAVTGGVFILFFLRHMWIIAFLICFCAFYQVGFGFTMGEVEMSLVLVGTFFAITWWRKKKLDRPPALENWSFGLLNTFLLLWLVYVLGHTIFNIYDPYRPADYALKNLLKTVEGWVAPVLLIAYFGNRPQYIDVRRDFPRRVAWCLLIGLSVNIVIRLFQQVTGGYDPISDPNDPLAADYFTVPVVNLMENVYALRSTAPTAMLFCSAFIVTRWFKEQPFKKRRLFYIVMALSIVGAILSGGRATLAFVFGLFAIFLVIQRRIGVLFGFAAFAALLVGAANVMPGAVKNSPSFVRRSLNWALIEKDVETSGDIQSSTNWRLALFNRALDEWRSDSRIYWFGRATYSYGIDDVIAMQISDDAPIESALRRGATHNMVTDLLVTFGLVGLILFVVLYWALLYFLWTLYRNRQLDELARSLSLFMLISLAFNFTYAVLGGGNIPMVLAWFFTILIAYLYGLHAEAQRSTASTTKIEPPKVRRFAPPRPGGALPAKA